MKQSQRLTCQEIKQILVSLLLLVCLLEIIFGACQRGYYGNNCQYSCRCVYRNCDRSGNCLTNASCFDKYFGPECQYINMVNISRYVGDWVHDNNDSTCNPSSSPRDIRVYLKETTFMTWFRLHYQYPQRLGDAYEAIKVKLNGTTDCLNKRVYLFRTGVVDVSCDNILLMSSLVLSGRITTMFCNIYVSGGRNVVYRRNTTIIGVDRSFATLRPVDDNTYCQLAFPEVAKEIIIDLPNPHLLFKITFYMPFSTTTSHEFLAQMMSGPNVTISRTVRSTAVHKVGLFMFDWSSFTRLRIKITPQAEICEVQTTGETFCDLHQYGYECERQCMCESNEICFTPTGMCGPECPPGSYGFLCSLRCGNCVTGKCDYRTGKCKCSDGFKDDGICLTQCSQGTYGYNCSRMCSGHCKGTSGCDRVSGNCTECVDGYYGSRCHLQCSTSCLNSKCNKVTGKCISCADGYFGENCTSRCPEGCLDSKCDFTRGGCLHCKPNKFGVKNCPTSECTGTRLTCDENCGVVCLNRLCNETTGKCVSCAAGFEGPDCNAKDCPANCRTTNGCNRTTSVCHDCKDGHYGSSCQNSCSSKCVDSICLKTTGACASCKVGFFGAGCSSPCPEGCLNSICSVVTGGCMQCKPSRFGTQPCPAGVCPGTYLTCHDNCSISCLNKLCYSMTGKCVVCADGYEGPDCIKKEKDCPANCKTGCDKDTSVCNDCKDGYFGPSCQHPCPRNCVGSTCNKTTGNCASCSDGYFGANCTNQCPDGCLSPICNFISGGCSTCKPNKFGMQPCPAGACDGSILACNLNCSEGCFNNTCDQATGKCASCSPGYTGDYCTLSGCPEYCKTANGCNRVTSVCDDCKDDYFGPSCQQVCSKNCLTPVCEKSSGNCSDCQTGYFDPTCSSQCVEGCLGSRCNSTTGSCLECKPSRFGVQPCLPTVCDGSILSCQSICSNGCRNHFCNQTTGECFACAAGFEGPSCTLPGCPEQCAPASICKSGNCTECKVGHFGPACQFYCSKNCLNTTCDKVTGDCTSCKTGYYGPACTKPCSDGCLDSICNASTGGCFHCKHDRFGVRDCLPSECEGSMLVCTETCHEGCLDQLCNKTTGVCFACASGFEGRHCGATDDDSLVFLWLALLFLPLLFCICVAWCFVNRKHNVAAVEEKVVPIKLSSEDSHSTSWTFATSFVTVSETISEGNTNVDTGFYTPGSELRNRPMLKPVVRSGPTYADAGAAT